MGRREELWMVASETTTPLPRNIPGSSAQQSLKTTDLYSISQMSVLRVRLSQNQPKESRRKEIIKIRGKINKVEIKKIEKVNNTKSCFFERVNKIDKPLARLTRKKREKTQIKK